ncbi:MAG: hypothetical protein H0W44_10675 [Gammaproteobacteria bacterium]|nr:hypothetical protein [Gammaproteobacteria bacterium]
MTAITLDEVEQRFTQWRLTRKAGDKIPKPLWDLVQQVLPHYKLTPIIRRLHLSTSQLRQRGLLAKADKPTSPIPAFVTLALQPPPATQPCLVLERHDGVKLSLIAPSMEHTHLLITTFLA